MPIKATDKTFLLRLPVDLYAFLEEYAKEQDRSVNNVMLLALKELRTKIEKERAEQKPN